MLPRPGKRHLLSFCDLSPEASQHDWIPGARAGMAQRPSSGAVPQDSRHRRVQSPAQGPRLLPPSWEKASRLSRKGSYVQPSASGYQGTITGPLKNKKNSDSHFLHEIIEFTD